MILSPGKYQMLARHYKTHIEKFANLILCSPWLIIWYTHIEVNFVTISQTYEEISGQIIYSR